MPDSRPVLYLLPGLLCDATCWQHQQAALTDIVELRIPSFKGFSSFQTMAASVLEQAPPRFSVAGHSMGGRVAWELMRQAGNRIDRFAVLDTGIHGVGAQEPAKREAFLALARQSMQALADAWIPPMLHPDRREDRALIHEIEKMVLAYSYEEFQGQIAALLGRSDQSRYLPEIENEVLLVCGAQDEWSPVEQHQEMLALLKHAKLEVIENSGHMSTMEQPEEVNRILLEWLKN